MARTTHMQPVDLGDSNANYHNIMGSFNNHVYNSGENAHIMH